MKLTKRQQDVLGWVQQGATNKSIAKRMNISESTVKLHITGILKAYGVQSRAQLLAYAAQNKTSVLPDLEEHPFAWVKISGNGITGFALKQIDETYKPVYLRKNNAP